jgi:hypothetical protein
MKTARLRVAGRTEVVCLSDNSGTICVDCRHLDRGHCRLFDCAAGLRPAVCAEAERNADLHALSERSSVVSPPPPPPRRS